MTGSAKQSRAKEKLDRFVLTLLAMAVERMMPANSDLLAAPSDGRNGS
jgi:hypothetical protein